MFTQQCSLGNVWIASPNAFVSVDSVTSYFDLGSGKIDHQFIKVHEVGYCVQCHVKFGGCSNEEGSNLLHVFLPSELCHDQVWVISCFQVAKVVEVPLFLLQVELQPAVKAEHFRLTAVCLSHEHVLESGRVGDFVGTASVVRAEPQVVQLALECSCRA